MNLLGRTKIVPSIVPVVSSSALTGVVIDCAGFDRVCHIIAVGAIATGGKLDYKVTESAASNGANATNVTGAELTQITDTGGSKIYAIDVPVNPAKPYQIAVGVAATANVAVSAVAVLYEGSGTFPKTAATQAVIL
jgi:hypothetical protein